MTIIEELYEAVLEGDFDDTPELTQEGLDAGFGPQELIDRAMIPAMTEAGRRFEDDEYFVPELLSSGRAIKGGLDVLRPLLLAGEADHAGTVVIGTVQGDLHDIGKNLVAQAGVDDRVDDGRHRQHRGGEQRRQAHHLRTVLADGGDHLRR